MSFLSNLFNFLKPYNNQGNINQIDFKQPLFNKVQENKVPYSHYDFINTTHRSIGIQTGPSVNDLVSTDVETDIRIPIDYEPKFKELTKQKFKLLKIAEN